MTSLPVVPSVPLGAAAAIPQLGFGLWQVPDDEVGAAVAVALAEGYRHLDTARIYGNESGVGRALAAASVPRSELFVTTKLWNDDQADDSVLRAFDASMERLGLEVLDLYLIHWPVPWADRYVEAWRALLSLRETGRVRAVGVCNFQVPHLQRLYDETGELPCLNQVELHPYLQQRDLVAFHRKHGIVTESWSPLASGGDVLRDAVVLDVAAKEGVTPAQVIIRWHLDQGFVVIPKSVTPSRIRENISVFGFELDTDDMERLATLDRGLRTGPDPDRFRVDAVGR